MPIHPAGHGPGNRGHAKDATPRLRRGRTSGRRGRRSSRRTALWLALTLAATTIGPAPAVAVHGAPSTPLALVPAAELMKWLSSGTRPVLVDLRPAEAFRQGRLPGARSLPLRELRRRVGELPAGRVVLYCDCPVEEVDAAHRFLRDRGFDDVRALAGGFAGWAAAGFPIER